ncbi:Alpha-1 3/1 6-mannosyltransferase alg-2 [Gryganskiella cystojenkinii]|nr:Alpha-1 3/1 6-mannosyltransferase alg-2 [Gryganskiella cystojenkinii]
MTPQQSPYQAYTPATTHQNQSYNPAGNLVSQQSSRSLASPVTQQSPIQHQGSPYNHYNTYQRGPEAEQQHQRQQYHALQQQQQQQHLNGGSVQPPLNTLKDWFNAVDTDGNGTLSAQELQRALMNGDGWTPFNMETVRMMISMFDKNCDGSISFDEFIGLWNYIEKWKTCFQTFDQDRSGTIDAQELHTALTGFGYNLSPITVDLIVKKYDVRGRGDITFDNFVQGCVTVQNLTDSFRRLDHSGTGVVTMTYEQFLQLVIGNRTG